MAPPPKKRVVKLPEWQGEAVGEFSGGEDIGGPTKGFQGVNGGDDS